MSPTRALSALLACTLLTACSTPAVSGSGSAAVSRVAATTTATGFWDAGAVHTIALTIDPDDYTAMVEAYRSGGEKEWVHAGVTIDGQAFKDVGVRLKGNLTLKDVTTATDPADVPYLLKLDEFVDDQSLDGWTELAVRASTSETALTEALALDLLGKVGLATEAAVSSRLSVNGAAAQLRLVVQNPDSTWDASQFSTEGTLYKAEAGGDYSYRGDDPAAYDEVFEQETHKKTPDLSGLTAFLQFVNQSSDADFAAHLDEHLDTRAFATYLAFEALIGNDDDIEGGGNNSYLRYDEGTGRMTVVAWDHNSAFGGGIGPGGGRGAMRGGPPPGGMRGGPGGASRSNALLQRFQAVPAFAALVTEASARLQASLFGSGTAATALQARVAVLTAQATDVVSAATVREEAAAVQARFPG